MRIARINDDSPDLELGVRFLPTDEQLIRYLIRFVASNNFICNDIPLENIYGRKKQWKQGINIFLVIYGRKPGMAI